MSVEETMAGSGDGAIGGSMPAGLRVSLTGAGGNAVAITKTPAVIGRSGCDLILPHATVSTRHAILYHASTGFVISDQGATNGTFLNGTRLSPFIATAIQNLDEIRFGDITFIFNLVEDRFNMHADADSSDRHYKTQPILETLLIASAPSVAALPAGQIIHLHAVTAGKTTVSRLQLRITTVGRTEGDLTVQDQTLSRKHFQIEVHPDHLALKDLGSANGTHVNGKPISYARIVSGQEFTAGRTRFRLELKS